MLYRAGSRELPVLRMLDEPPEVVRARAERLAALTGGDRRGDDRAGGRRGASDAEFPSYACALELELAEPLRRGEPPVVGIVRDDRLLLDCRTLADSEVDELAAAVAAARVAHA